MYFLLLIPGINLVPPTFFFLALHIVYNWSRSHLSFFWDRWDRYINGNWSREESRGAVDEESQSGCPPRVHLVDLNALLHSPTVIMATDSGGLML
jgi:hypothetical protein